MVCENIFITLYIFNKPSFPNRKKFWEKVHLPIPVTFQVSHVTCHMSPVTCHISCVTCHFFLSFFFFFLSLSFGQSGKASQGRVCYQRGLPLLVSQLKNPYNKAHYSLFEIICFQIIQYNIFLSTQTLICKQNHDILRSYIKTILKALISIFLFGTDIWGVTIYQLGYEVIKQQRVSY